MRQRVARLAVFILTLGVGSSSVAAAAAEAAGLLRRTDYGPPVVADHPSTVVELDADPSPRVVRVDGLADRGADAELAAAQRSAREALRVFARRVTNPAFYRRTLATR
jgi:hypothetical protein